MLSRRKFLRNGGAYLGGLTFCSCGILNITNAQNQIIRRPPIVIQGKKIKAIDVHAHCYFQEAIDLMGEDAKSVLAPTRGQTKNFINVSERINAMEAQGVDMQVLSINPYWYKKDRDIAEAICKINNTNLHKLCQENPNHFAGFASIAMQFPDLAVRQLEEAVNKFKLVGAAIGGSVLGDDFSNPKYHPIFAKAQELDVALFIHPQSTPQLASRFKGNGWLSNLIGNPLDTTIALEHLIFDGTLDKFPKIKIIAAHGGGYLPFYAPRSDHSCEVSPTMCNPNIQLNKKPTEYLRQLYFDSLVFTSDALNYLKSQVGASQIMVGSDHPIPWAENPVDHVLQTIGLTDEEKIAILSGNASRVLNLKI